MLKIITVRELIAKLENENPDAKVLFTAVVVVGFDDDETFLVIR